MGFLSDFNSISALHAISIPALYPNFKKENVFVCCLEIDMVCYFLPSFMTGGGRGGGVGRGGGRGVTRSPSAIKEMLLNWTKAMTAGYEVLSGGM